MGTQRLHVIRLLPLATLKTTALYSNLAPTALEKVIIEPNRIRFVLGYTMMLLIIQVVNLLRVCCHTINNAVDHTGGESAACVAIQSLMLLITGGESAAGVWPYNQ